MRVLIAPDSFKGSLPAGEVAAALARGLARAGWTCELAPIADGGEGSLEALTGATGGERRSVRVRGPLGEPVTAEFGILGDGRTAVIEMARASGLTLVAEGARDPLRADTYGTGELMAAALDAGCRNLIVAIGGSATNDGGAGMARALGARLLDRNGAELPPGGAALAKLDRIDATALKARLQGAQVLVACDVDNPFTGPRGASAVFGPQKGADAAAVRVLDAALTHYAGVIERDLGVAIGELPGAGAAGGLGGGLVAFCGARLAPGVELIFAALKLEERLRTVDLAVTGEGRIDEQTLMGKGPAGVAALARRLGVPCVAVGGGLSGDRAALHEAFDALIDICPRPIALSEAIAQADALLEEAAYELGCTLNLGARLGVRA
ncbi:MAG TPA: glycerate kinase [Limnochordia bacterium]|nr:glycerate kinase [Limnochordia bacterium]